MRNQPTPIRQTLFAAALGLSFLLSAADAQTTSFTYQGKLADNGSPATANYDFQFKLFNAPSGGTQIGATLMFDGSGSNPAVDVTDGIFTVTLDFGTCTPPSPCFDGNPRFLEIAVRQHGIGSYVTLTPRQPITSTPYAIKTQTLTFNGPYNDAAMPPTVFTATNTFAGEGAGVNTTPNPDLTNPFGKFNSFFGAGAGQANTIGSQNAIFGAQAGQANTQGNGNAFFGRSAGFSNTLGHDNAFFGVLAGRSNTIGVGNAFFGAGAGGENRSGTNNTFIGQLTDFNVSSPTGNNNTLLGAIARINSGVSNGTAIGANASVTQSNSLVLGSINGVNNATADTNVGIGTTAPSQRLHVVGNGLFTGDLTVNGTLNASLPGGSNNYIQSNPMAPQSASFNINGNGTVVGTLNAGVVNAATQYNIVSPALGSGIRLLGISGTGDTNTFLGRNAAAANPTGSFNSFFGNGSGQNTVDGGNNSFFGSGAGSSNVSGADNAFFGRNAGNANTSRDNSFYGSFAGAANTTGYENSFFGKDAGRNSQGQENSLFGYQAGFSTLGNVNSFFGSWAGLNNTEGSSNAFFGASAGRDNSMGGGNAFFGYLAGSHNTTGNDNSYFGSGAGLALYTGDKNSFFGTVANGVDGISNATAIGYRAFVAQSNSLVLGSINGMNLADADTNVGIGTSTPTSRLHISGTGVIRAQINSDSNAGFALALGNQLKWSLATVTGGQFQIYNEALSSNAVWIDPATNNVGIGTTTPGADKLAVNGFLRLELLGGGNTTTLCRNSSNQISNCSSSIRYKTNVAPLPNSLSLISRLRPVLFDWKANKQPDVGLIAEEVAKVEPLLTFLNENGEIEGVKYDRVTAVLVNAMKEQQAQIERQQHLIERQQQQLAALKKLVCKSHRNAQACK